MLSKIDELKNIFKDLELKELKYKDLEFEIELKKESSNKIVESEIKTKTKIEKKENENISNGDKNFYKIESPLVGLFYKKPSPDEDCFVDINKSVKKGDILCVLEAMKMFNEVKSPIDGIVKCINFKDEDLVSVGDILFEIEEV